MEIKKKAKSWKCTKDITLSDGTQIKKNTSGKRIEKDGTWYFKPSTGNYLVHLDPTEYQEW